MVEIDQTPIGRTPRSNPATYTGVFDDIRKLFAKTQDAQVRGYGPGRFSFNVKGGRCESCQGDGLIKIEMNFLPDVYVTCEVCKGKRYNPETLAVHYKGKSIAEVLAMSISEGREYFGAIPAIKRKLKTLEDVGSVTCNWGKVRRHCLVARHSGSSCRKNSHVGPPDKRSTFSTSPRRDCTFTTPTNF